MRKITVGDGTMLEEGDRGYSTEKGTSFSIAGGPGRAQYTLAEIAAASRAIALIGEDVGEIVTSLWAERNWLSDFSQQESATLQAGSYPTHFQSSLAIDSIRAAALATTAAQNRLLDLARNASNAVQNYEDSEAKIVAFEYAKQDQAFRDGLAAWSNGPFAQLTMSLQAFKMLRDGEREGMRDKSEDILNDSSAYFMGLLGPQIGMWYFLIRRNAAERASSGIIPALNVRKLFDRTGLARPGHMQVRQVPPREWHGEDANWQPGRAVPGPLDGVSGKLESSFKSMLAGSQSAYGYPAGSVEVVRLDRPDGTRAWVLHLPGTEDWSTVDSSNPFDMEGNLEAMTAAHKELFSQHQVVMQDLMKESLKAAGALPTQEVLITGHSGGGIHAAAAAADPAFLAEVNVKMLVIAGAPGGSQHVAPGIDVLDLENEHDIVTGADYGPPPDAEHWVTVTSHRPRGGKSPAAAHSIKNYVDDAAVLDQSQDPGIKRLKGNLDEFMQVAVAGGAVKVTKFVFQGTDIDGPKPAKKKDKEPILFMPSLPPSGLSEGDPRPSLEERLLGPLKESKPRS